MGKKKGAVRVKQVGPKMPPMMPVNPMEAFQIPPEEMVNLPPDPDRKYQIFWPMHETFTMKTTGFQVIYPSYLDSTKPLSMGRRISSEKAVPTPTVSDLSLALQMMRVRHVLQPYKGYSRDPACLWDNPGRVLVDVSQHTKKELIYAIAERIPHMPERQARLERERIEAERHAEIEASKLALQSAATKKTPQAITNSASGGNNKKKGKKGRRNQ
jgi:signal recognition particle subunit SRP19